MVESLHSIVATARLLRIDRSHVLFLLALDLSLTGYGGTAGDFPQGAYSESCRPRCLLFTHAYGFVSAACLGNTIEG